MQRRFGEAVHCRFVDVKSGEAAAYPGLAEGLGKKRLKLPVVAIGGSLRYHGVFSPTFIQRDVTALLGGERGRRQAPSPRRSEVVGRAGFATSVIRSKG